MNLCDDLPYLPYLPYLLYLLTSLPLYLLTSLPPYCVTCFTCFTCFTCLTSFTSLPPYLLTSLPPYLLTALPITDTQSLVSLVRALVAVSRGASGDQDSGEAAVTVAEATSPGKAARGQNAGGQPVSVSVGSVTFCLRLLTEIALRNRDRIESTSSIIPCCMRGGT